MKEVFEYCRQNPVLILSVLTLIVEVIVIFVKRRPKTLDDFVFALNEVRSMVAVLVEKVEVPGNGEIKKAAVIKSLVSSLSTVIGRELTEKEKGYAVKIFETDIENVLSAPKKKEKINEK